RGLAGTSNEVIRVNADGSWTPVANLSQFLMTHPVASPDADDYEPDGTWYSLVAAHGSLYADEPNHQEIDRITPAGTIERLVDFSAIYPRPLNWHGPTALTFAQVKLYVG